MNETNSKIISKIEHAAENSDYETVLNELKNYRSNFDEVVAKNQIYRPLNIGNSIDNHPPQKVNIPIKYTNMTIPKNFTPHEAKTWVDLGMAAYNLPNKMPDAKELWKASSHDFEQSKSYITKNGNLIYSVSELPTQELQNIVTNKLQSQLHVKDAMGIIFGPYSSLSIDAANSLEIKEHFLSYNQQLLKGQVVKQGSTKFISNENLAKSFGKAEFLYSFIDQNGNFNTLVLDTYDFNPNDVTWEVQIAEIAQNGKVIRNFYTLNIVSIPYQKWVKWLK